MSAVIVRNSFQALKVRIVYLVVVLGGLAMIVAGVNICLSWGLATADGGILKPLPQRLAFGGGLAGLALVLIAGMHYYLLRYIVSMRRDGSQLYIRTAAQLRGPGHVFAAGDVVSLDYHAGKTLTYKAYVNAPWKKMRIRGVRLPFIIDMQAEYINKAELEKLLARNRRESV